MSGVWTGLPAQDAARMVANFMDKGSYESPFHVTGAEDHGRFVVVTVEGRKVVLEVVEVVS